MLSKEATQKILGIKEKVSISPFEMADEMNVTFFPINNKISKNVLNFSEKLREVFDELQVNVVPFEDSLEIIPFSKRIKRFFFVIINNVSFLFFSFSGKRKDRIFIDFEGFKKIIGRKKTIKQGISVVSIGGDNTDKLPIDYVTSFKKSSIITIIDMPNNINETSSFKEHFDVAMNLFAKQMTNLVIATNSDRWILYNFNASHPTFNIKSNFKEDVLKALIPKIVAPITPLKFSDFIIEQNAFDVLDGNHFDLVEDLQESGKIIEKTNLYPLGKKINDLPFQNSFYKLVGRLHLDNRSGMSYGFLARQMPIELSNLEKFSEENDLYKNKIEGDGSYFIGADGKFYIILEIFDERLFMKIPDVWILSQRSGSDKMNINPKKDLLKLGLIDGKMYLRTPIGSKLTPDYKPSFDTAVMLAHGVGNAILGSVFKYLDRNKDFVNMISRKGVAISHWHGYINPNKIPRGWHVYGIDNPHVSCSTPQSAVYALKGKLEMLDNLIETNDDYLGDIHVEPHHGTNMNSISLKNFGGFVLGQEGVSEIGNKYLYYPKS